MIPLGLPTVGAGLRLLCLGAHSDDIEIGSGGTVLQLLERGDVDVRWVVLSATGTRATEARESAAAFLASARNSQVDVHEHRDGFFPTQRGEIKGVFEDLKQTFEPDLILTHEALDLHQDHALLSALTRETFRDHLILGYEVPKFDGGLRSPNVFVPIQPEVKERKIDLILQHFPTQRTKHWLDEETLTGIMRLRGVESASPTRYAEGFHGAKLRLAV